MSSVNLGKVDEVRQRLVAASDILGELFATLTDLESSGDFHDRDGLIGDKLAALNLEIWTARWEIGPDAGDLRANPDESDGAEHSESEAAQ